MVFQIEMKSYNIIPTYKTYLIDKIDQIIYSSSSSSSSSNSIKLLENLHKHF
jgi:hypothetical protein